MKIFKTRNDLIKTLEHNLIVCEIGVFKGEFSKFIKNQINPKELHLIDVFEGTICSGDKDGNNIVWVDLHTEYIKLQTWAETQSGVYIHKGFSSGILKNFNDNYFDLIYIDGDHSYEGVKKDLEISHSKIKPNGYILGHDYTPQFQGVMDAVNEFCSKYDLTLDSLTEDGCPTFLIYNTK
jgi:hypothetical protein